MLAWTAASVAAEGSPEVMTPSYQVPTAPSLLSPPVPRMIAPCFFMG